MESQTPYFETYQSAQVRNVYNQPDYFDWSLVNQYNELKSPFTLIALDMNNFDNLNARHGHIAGDEALRWVSLVLSEESGVPAYRVGSDEFMLILEGEDKECHLKLAERIVERLNHEGSQVRLGIPAATVAMIHYGSGNGSSSSNLIGDVYSAIDEAKDGPRDKIKVFNAIEIQPVKDFQYIVRNLANQLDWLAAKLDEMHHLAHTDPLTGLPNLRAAVRELEMAITKSRLNGEPLSILLIDGDDLKRYNDINYSAGDEMIRNLGVTQKRHLRAGDFLARWRMGDEFLLIMSATTVDEALEVGERIRSAVEQESQAWLLPVTISAGLATYPEHGDTLSELLYQAEEAINQAKSMGKNQIVAASYNSLRV